MVPSSFILHLLSGSVVHPFLFMMPPLPWSPSQTLLPSSSQWPICPSPQLLWSCSSLPYNTIRALVVKLCIWLKVLQCSCGQVQAPCVAWGPLLPSSFPQALSCVCVQPPSVPLNVLVPLLRALITAPTPPSLLPATSSDGSIHFILSEVSGETQLSPGKRLWPPELTPSVAPLPLGRSLCFMLLTWPLSAPPAPL